VKERATIVCRRGDQVLLVARDRSRWALPGGTIKRLESPLDAARRELAEETAIEALELHFMFQFGGLSKRHYVFLADLPERVMAEPRNEITRCRWFHAHQVTTLATSIPTRCIVALCFPEQHAPFPEMRRMDDGPGAMLSGDAAALPKGHAGA
jgi:8-oxo-dGTP diphosphatase